MATTPWLEDAYRDARQEFLLSVPRQYHQDFANFGTIDHVYTEIRDIQRQQAKTKTLVALKRIEPYLNGLKDYFGVIDTFSQVQPEIICLIWGPLKLILQLASSATTAFKKLVVLLEDVSHTLPHFKKYAESGIFDNNDQVKGVMCLFYRDILDLHLEMFKFFSKPNLHTFLESLWPQFRNKLSAIQDNVKSHKTLMTDNVMMEHVLEADKYRRHMLEQCDKRGKHEADSRFRDLSDRFSSPACKSRLQDSVETSSNTPGDWLFNDTVFQACLKGVTSKERFLWIQGIPGAGKTTATANAIRQLRTQGNTVLFAFVTHENPSFGSMTPILNSFLFQLVEANRDLVREVYEPCTGQEVSKKLIMDLFCKLGKTHASLFVVIDGLDETDSWKRAEILNTLLAILDTCDNIRIIVSSREERDVVNLLREKVVSVRVNERNGKDIESYVQAEGVTWISRLRELGADDGICKLVEDGLKDVVSKANGMFLYAKLVLKTAQFRPDIQSIMDELSNLPDGLDQAYGRLFSRFRNDPEAKTVLLWMTCSQRPLKEVEILQALIIKSSMEDFSYNQKKAFIDIWARCGPIIEMRGDAVHFVHFTAQKFLLDIQSEKFLTLQLGHLTLLEACSTYFCFKPFDHIFLQDFSEANKKELESRILSEDFILFRYAIDFWLEHAKALGQEQMPDLKDYMTTTKALARLQNDRAWDDNMEELRSEYLRQFRVFKDTPQLQRLLGRSLRFHERLETGQVVQEEDNWVYEDPTKLSLANKRFQEALESILDSCESSTHPNTCTCRTILKLYGPAVYRCKWAFCDYHRSGFSDKTTRDTHEEKTHQSRLYCPESSCSLSQLKFKTEKDLADHTTNFHQHLPTGSIIQPARLHSLATAETMAILESAVVNGDIEVTQSLLALPDELGDLDDIDFDLLLQLAVWAKSNDLIEFIISKLQDTSMAKTKKNDILGNALMLTLFTNNLDAARCLLKNGTNPEARGVVHTRLQTRYLRPNGIDIDNSRARNLVIDTAFQLPELDFLELLMRKSKYVIPRSYYSWHIRQTATNQEEFAARHLVFKRYVSSNFYRVAAFDAVRFGHAKALQICFSNGVDPNSRGRTTLVNESLLGFAIGRSVSDRTPLFYVFERIPYSPEERMNQMEVVTTLLHHGANPYCRDVQKRRSVGELRAVEEYFGMNWDTLVQRIKASEDISPEVIGG
ncbi:hypothetical protein B0T17DRAFT_517828 [Bombardia bombarda]|uniref:NACHT domain-containing protein n=1 Tax=Bombardia bombarda TaxID=252184 RepID=A0AA39XMJ5_9PEZI|nr:hypothetical protein B0T17DRAFT_517828 [Bombardia bombarda]